MASKDDYYVKKTSEGYYDLYEKESNKYMGRLGNGTTGEVLKGNIDRGIYSVGEFVKGNSDEGRITNAFCTVRVEGPNEDGKFGLTFYRKSTNKDKKFEPDNDPDQSIGRLYESSGIWIGKDVRNPRDEKKCMISLNGRDDANVRESLLYHLAEDKLLKVYYKQGGGYLSNGALDLMKKDKKGRDNFIGKIVFDSNGLVKSHTIEKSSPSDSFVKKYQEIKEYCKDKGLDFRQIMIDYNANINAIGQKFKLFSGDAEDVDNQTNQENSTMNNQVDGMFYRSGENKTWICQKDDKKYIVSLDGRNPVSVFPALLYSLAQDKLLKLCYEGGGLARGTFNFNFENGSTGAIGSIKFENGVVTSNRIIRYPSSVSNYEKIRNYSIRRNIDYTTKIIESNGDVDKVYNMFSELYGQDFNQNVLEFEYGNRGWSTEDGYYYISANGGESPVFGSITVLEKLIKDGFAKLYRSGKSLMDGICGFFKYGEVTFGKDGKAVKSTIKGIENVKDGGRAAFYDSVKNLLRSDFDANISKCNGSMGELIRNSKLISDIVGDTSSGNYYKFAEKINDYLNGDSSSPDTQNNFYQQNQRPGYQQQGAQSGYQQQWQGQQQNQQSNTNEYNKTGKENELEFFYNGNFFVANNGYFKAFIGPSGKYFIGVEKFIEDPIVILKMFVDGLVKVVIMEKILPTSTKHKKYVVKMANGMKIIVDSKGLILMGDQTNNEVISHLNDFDVTKKYDYVKKYYDKMGLDFEREILKAGGDLSKLAKAIENKSNDALNNESKLNDDSKSKLLEMDAKELETELDNKFVQDSIDKLKEEADNLNVSLSEASIETLDDFIEVIVINGVNEKVSQKIKDNFRAKFKNLETNEKKVNAISRFLLRVSSGRAQYKERSIVGKLKHLGDRKAKVADKKIRSGYKNVAEYIVKCVKKGSGAECLTVGQKIASAKCQDWRYWLTGVIHLLEDLDNNRNKYYNTDYLSDYRKEGAIMGILFARMTGLETTENIICACDALKDGGIKNCKNQFLNDVTEIRKAIKAKCTGKKDANAEDFESYIRKLCVNDYKIISRAGFDQVMGRG